MKLLSEAPTSNNLPKLKYQTTSNRSTNLESRFLSAKAEAKQRLDPDELEACGRAGWIARRCARLVDYNHWECNLEFRERPNLLHARFEVLRDGLAFPPLALQGFHGGRRVNNLEVPQSVYWGFTSKDFQAIHTEMKRILISKRILKENLSREVPPPSYTLEERLTLDIQEFGTLKNSCQADLISTITHSRESSILVQAFIQNCNPKDLSCFVEKVRPYLGELLVHSSGSFVLQKLVSTYLPGFQIVMEYTLTNFSDLIQNPYSSRVIQILIENSQEFCQFASNFFKENIELSVSMSSICHLLVATLKHSGNIYSRDYILTSLKEKPFLASSKYFHRALITYLHLGNQEQLDRAAFELGVTSKIAKFFKSKANYSIVHTLIKRGHTVTIAEICRQLQSNPIHLLQTRYFTSTIFHVAQMNHSALTSVYETLIKLPIRLLISIGSTLENSSQFVFLLLTCSSESKSQEVSAFLMNCPLTTQISAGGYSGSRSRTITIGHTSITVQNN